MFNIKPLQENQYNWWNNFVDNSNGGTIFHRLDFLEYHGNKYKNNENHLVIYKGDSPIGILPLIITDNIAKSPYGGSYGGPIFKTNLDYKESNEIIETILNYLINIEVNTFIITLPIAQCYKVYSDTFRFCLLENNFKYSNRDISSIVLIDKDKTISDQITSRARNMVRKATNLGVNIIEKGSISDFWKVLNLTYQKHGVNPTHSFDQFQYLYGKLPGKIYVDVAYYKNIPISGIGYFVINNLGNSSFYFAQDPEFQNMQALSLLIYNGLEKSKQINDLWFDFGTSTSNMKGKVEIFNFKESFNSIGSFRDTFKWEKL